MLMAATLPPNMRETQIGVERRCSRCHDWWPVADDPIEGINAFWSEKKPGVLYSYCRSCHTEYSTERRRRVRQSG